MNIVTVVMLGAGVTLIYAGIKGVDPRNVVRDAISGKDNPGGAPEVGPGEQAFDMPEEGTGTARV